MKSSYKYDRDNEYVQQDEQRRCITPFHARLLTDTAKPDVPLYMP